MEFYNASSGETKEKATQQLQGGCRELLRSIVGADRADELKAMKESGSSVHELATKADEFLKQVTDDGKKQMVEEYGPACRKLFGVGGEAQPAAAAPSRMRRSRRNGGETQNEGEVYIPREGEYSNDGEETQARSGGAGSRRRTNQQQQRQQEEEEGNTNANAVEEEVASDVGGGEESDFERSHHGWLNDEQKQHLREHREQGGNDATVQQKVLKFIKSHPLTSSINVYVFSYSTTSKSPVTT